MSTLTTTSADGNKANYRRFIEEIWNRGNFDLIDLLITDDYIAHDPASPNIGRGLESLIQRANPYRKAFPDLHITIEEIIAEDDKVVTRWSSSGTHQGDFHGIPPSGKLVTSSGINISRFAKGKIVEEWTNWDIMGLIKQLGGISQ
ncbi:ester cyclase [Pelatocladus sp. BLCC-F211]|uniref:ester cyclase n=1 Tax=Pelatocladus sp. BLCC-F211 TaxID=3342752 RepID=UPI0035B8B157